MSGYILKIDLTARCNGTKSSKNELKKKVEFTSETHNHHSRCLVLPYHKSCHPGFPVDLLSLSQMFRFLGY